MTFVLIGVNHRSAALEVRERLVFPPDSMPEVTRQIADLPSIEDAIVISTCNRTEILGCSRGEPERAIADLTAFLAGARDFQVTDLEEILYAKQGLDAVRHLFRLGVGLDSMVLGEPQILGQVKQAYQRASENGSLGGPMHGLLQRSFAVAKKVRTSTAIGRSPVSVSYAAVEMAEKIFGELKGRSVLLLGAGETAELTARHLVAHGIESIFVANRTFQRASELAREFDGEAVPFDRFREHLEVVDVLISSTSAPHAILNREEATGIIRRRRNRPLFLIDIAVPRDIDPAVNEIDNIFLYDLDDLQHVADDGLEERRLAAEHAERLIEEEVRAFERGLLAGAVAPTIVALREKLHGQREEEIRRFGSQLRNLPPEQLQAITELTSSLINKVLHGPIRHLKRSAGSPEGPARLDWVREMFGLGKETAEPKGREERCTPVDDSEEVPR